MTRPLVLLLLAALAGCGGPPSHVTFLLRAARDINPDADAGPAPAPVRLFLLSSTLHLQNADYFTLLDHERDALDGDLLARRETIIRPGGSQDIRMDVPEGTTDVGVIVGFRELDRATWVATRPIPGNGRVPVLLGEWTVSLPRDLPPEPKKQ